MGNGFAFNGSGTVVASYQYDPFGNLVSTEPAANSIGAINPLRYRGYVYDTESRLYYLQSRYYDPKIGRFINADALVSTGQGVLGFNMFAYCRNNPVRRRDVQGNIEEDCLTGDDKDDLFTHPDGGYSGSSEVISTDYPTGQQTGNAGNSGGQSAPTYPQNPFDFNPNGLERRVHVEPGKGTNGGIIKWYYPGDKRPIFEWNEDWANGSHYHAMEVEWGSVHSGDHLWPNSEIVEPWRSRFL